MSDDTGGDHGW